MTDSQQREAARQFFYRWNGKGKEDEHARSYWIELLSDVFGVERVTERVEFEKKVAGEQSKKRTHRIGQNQTCFYYYPLVQNSIEVKNLKALKEGKELTDDLFKIKKKA